MKKLVSLLLALALFFSFSACGNNTAAHPETNEPTPEGVDTPSAPATVLSNDYMKIDGICVDDSYRDADNSPLRMVFLFYTVTSLDSNLQIDSVFTNLTINGNNTYESEYIPDACNYASSYYYSGYIKDVYIGSSLKVVATFKIPEADLATGRSITLTDDQIPNIEAMYFTTDDIQHFDSNQAVAEAMDSDGYASAILSRQPVDADTTAKVKTLLSGFYWSFYVNMISYEIEFYAENNYELRTSLGTSTTGEYTVTNGYIMCTNSATGAVNELPYTIENNDIKLDVAQGFDVKS